MMDCRKVQPRIADFSVGLLRAGEMRQMEEHLAACAACGREWRELQAVLSLVERHGSREPPPHLWNGVFNRITAAPAPAALSFWQRLLGVPGQWVAGAATGLAAAALVVTLTFQPFNPSQPQPESPTATSPVAVQQHAMLAGMEPFADDVALEAYARMVNHPDNSHPVR
jgi:anti-sigma-K factor RskA